MFYKPESWFVGGISLDNQVLVRAVASSQDNAVNVFIFNYDENTDFSGRVRLDNTFPTADLAIKAKGGITTEHAFTLERASTLLLEFAATVVLTEECRYRLDVEGTASVPPLCQ